MALEIEWEDDDKFWLPIRRYIPEQDMHVSAGEILVSVNIIPKEVAVKYPQGLGRQEPNNDPFCPQPEGRIKLTFNPIEMIGQLIPPQFRRQILMALCGGFCVFLCILMAPMIISNLIAKLLIG